MKLSDFVILFLWSLISFYCPSTEDGKVSNKKSTGAPTP